MKISSKEEYGLRCLMQVAIHDRQETPVRAIEIAKAEGLSLPYVNKLLHTLKQAGLVLSVRGVKGGFQLSRDMREITLFGAFKALNGTIYDNDFCRHFTGLKNKCVHVESSCSIRAVWATLEEYMEKVFSGITLQDLIGENECMMKKHLHAEFGKEAFCHCPSKKK